MSNQHTRPASMAQQARPTQPVSQKPRQLSHLHSQLAQLTASISDLESLLKVTAVQAESMRSLGCYAGAMFMAVAKVSGEDTVANEAQGNIEGSQSGD